MEIKILNALTEKFTGVKESILRRVAAKLAKTVESEDDIATAVEGAITDVLEAYGDQRATDAQKTAIANYERKHGLKDGKAVNGGEPGEEPVQEHNDTPEWALQLIEANKSLKERLDRMDGERIVKSRKSIIDQIIEPLSAVQRKAYQRTQLEGMSEDEFSRLQEEIRGEVAELEKENRARGAVFGRPAQVNKPAEKSLTKEEMAAMDKLIKK